ncbi:MAG: HAD family hydrolase [Clostridiales bacterium]|nr:HAD family hydrolase [Clostridiales bacterium]
MIKAVVFDFDGTLTMSKDNLWRSIWQHLGYSVSEGSYYRQLLNDFMSGKISHAEWCNLTLNAYREKGFDKTMFYDLVDKRCLNLGAGDLFKNLTDAGIKIYIVSGNIVSAIKRVLGDNEKYFSDIRANEFVFDNNGIINEIIGTKYDYEGKAVYIKDLCLLNHIDPSEVCFVGNGNNDEHVFQSGCKTVCINPEGTQPDNQRIWNKVVITDNLLDLQKEILDVK